MDYTQFKDQDVFSPLGKKIRYLIRSRTDFIVFLDTENEVWWHVRDGYRLANSAGQILGRLDLMANDPLVGLGPSVRVELRRYIAGVIADVLDWVNPDPRCVERVARVVNRAKSNAARLWVLSGASGGAATLLTVGLIGALLQARWTHGGWPYIVVDPATYGSHAMAAAAAGALGALASLLQRSGELHDDPTGIRPAHYVVEGIARVLTGAIGGAFLATATEADLTLGVLEGAENALQVSMTLGFVAGWSERLLPSLVERLAGSFEADGTETPSAGSGPSPSSGGGGEGGSERPRTGPEETGAGNRAPPAGANTQSTEQAPEPGSSSSSGHSAPPGPTRAETRPEGSRESQSTGEARTDPKEPTASLGGTTSSDPASEPPARPEGPTEPETSRSEPTPEST